MEVKQAAPKVAKIDMSLDEVVKTGLCRHTVPCAQPTVPRWRAHSGRRQPRLSRSFVCAPCRQRRQRAAGARQSQHARAGTQPATNSTGHYSMLSLSPPSLSVSLSLSLCTDKSKRGGGGGKGGGGAGGKAAKSGRGAARMNPYGGGGGGRSRGPRGGGGGGYASGYGGGAMAGFLDPETGVFYPASGGGGGGGGGGAFGNTRKARFGEIPADVKQIPGSTLVVDEAGRLWRSSDIAWKQGGQKLFGVKDILGLTQHLEKAGFKPREPREKKPREPKAANKKLTADELDAGMSSYFGDDDANPAEDTKVCPALQAP